MSAYSTFLADPNREDIFLYEIAAYKRSDGSTVTLRFSTAAYATEPGDSPANTPYLPVALGGYSFRAPAVTAETVGVVSNTEGATIELAMRRAELDSYRTTYALSGRYVTIKHGGTSAAGKLSYANYQTIKVAQISEALYGLNSVKITLIEQKARFEHPVEDRVLRGGSYALGGDGTSLAADLGTFNGITDSSDFGSKLASTTGDLTFECWVYIESLAAINTIYSARSATTNCPFHLEVAISGQLVARWSKGAAAKNYTTTTLTAITTKSWHFIAVSISGTSMTFWVYNFQTNVWDTEVYTHADVATRDAQTSGNIYLMKNPAGAFFNGQLDEVRLFITARTEATIKEQFARQLIPSEINGVSTLVLYCKMDDGTGGYVTDYSDPNGGLNQRTRGTVSVILTPTTEAGTADCVSLDCRAASDDLWLNSFLKPDETGASPTFTTDGWAVGDRGQSSGFTGAQNNGDFVVESISSHNGRRVMTVSGITLKRTSAGDTNAVLSKYTTNARWYATLTGRDIDSAGAGTNNQTEVPNVYGKVEGWAPPLVDPILMVYQVNADRIEAVNYVREGGAALTLGTAYTDLRTFLDTPSVLGTYDTLIYAGGSYVRLGSVPTYPVTVDLQGDKHGGTYVSTVATIWRRIITTRGEQPLTDPTELDTSSFTNHDTATGSAVAGIVIEAGKQIVTAGHELMETSGSVAWFARDTGKHTILRFAGASGTVTKDADGTTDFTITENDVVSDPEPQSVLGPFWKIDIPYRRCWSPLGTGNLVTSVKGTEAWRFFQSEYRYAKASDASVKTEYPTAGALASTVGLYAVQNNAQAEATRRLALYRDEPQCFKVVCRSRALWLDRYDTIYFDYGDFDEDNVRQQRLGTGAAVKFIVLGVEDDMEQAQTTLTLWRENASA